MLCRLAITLVLLFDLGLESAPAHEPSIARARQQAHRQATTARQPAQAVEQVRAIARPRNPVPPEEGSAGVMHFSFIYRSNKAELLDANQ